MNWLKKRKIEIAQEIEERQTPKENLKDSIKYINRMNYLLMFGLPVASISFLFQDGLSVIDSVFPLLMGSVLIPFMVFETSAMKLAVEKMEEKELLNNVAEIKQGLNNDFTNIFKKENIDDIELLNDDREISKFNKEVL